MFGVTLSKGSSCLHGVLEIHENAGLGNKGVIGMKGNKTIHLLLCCRGLSQNVILPYL